MRRALVLAACLVVTATLGAAHHGEAEAARPRSKARQEALRQRLGDAASHELELTNSANAVERAKVALERERESMAWAGELLEHRGNESLRRLDAYREHRLEREELSAVRARALYKLARGGGVLEMMFEDGRDGRLTATERAARGRTLRNLIDHDIEQLQVHARAEAHARDELLTANREQAVLAALDSLARIQSSSLETGAEGLHPTLAVAHEQRRVLQRRPREQVDGADKALLASLDRERRNLMRHRGLDLLEDDALIRPVPGRVIGEFGDYEDKLLKVPMHRNGVELWARPKDEVLALAPGSVAFVGALPGFERVVVVDHGGGYLSLTARLLSVAVEEGQEIEAGTVLGRVGPKAVDDGLGTTVYVEVRHGSRPIDPAPYLRPSKKSRGGKSKAKSRSRR